MTIYAVTTCALFVALVASTRIVSKNEHLEALPVEYPSDPRELRLPVSFVRYTDHQSGPMPYVFESVAPVARIVSDLPNDVLGVETTSLHGSVPLVTASLQDNASPPLVGPPPLPPYYANLLSNVRYETTSSPPAIIAPRPLPPYYPVDRSDGTIPVESKRSPDDDDDDDDDDDRHHHREDEEEDEEDEDEEGDDESDREEPIEPTGYDDFNDQGKITRFETKVPLIGNDKPKADKGSAHLVEGHSVYEEKDGKDYKNHRERSEGENQDYEEKGQRGHYDEKEDRKGGHLDANVSDGKREETEKHEKGNAYGENSYHRRGEKTNGYRKVYNKDEYKKSSDFYDFSHKDGNFEKHGAFEEHRGKVEGDYKKGGDGASELERRNSATKDYYDKGQENRHDDARKAEEGGESYHENYAGYGEEGAVKTKKKYDYGSERDRP